MSATKPGPGRALRLLGILLLGACLGDAGGEPRASRQAGSPAPEEPRGPASPAPTPAEPPPTSGAEPLRYVLTAAQQRVYLGRSSRAKLLGVVMAGARLPVFEEAPGEGPGCEGPWLRVQHRGWLCGDGLLEVEAGEEREAHPQNSFPAQAATVARETARYRYPGGPVVGALPEGKRVRVLRVVDLDGRSYAQIGARSFIAAEDLEYRGRGRGTALRGERFEEPPRAPLVFFSAKETPLFDAPGLTDPRRAIGKLRRYDRAPLLGRARVGGRTFLEVEGGWVLKKRGVSIVAPEPRPQGVPEGARWVLIDLSEQTLSAYEGERLVFATLVSSGRPDKFEGRMRTVTGTFPVRRKYRHKTMAGGEQYDEPYRVEDVPWAQFFHKGYALHGAFWHDSFGRPVSHGCVNLSVSDAKFLADFLEPRLPPGWLSLFPREGMERSVIVVRD